MISCLGGLLSQAFRDSRVKTVGVDSAIADTEAAEPAIA
jgi:hypothetical protein